MRSPRALACLVVVAGCLAACTGGSADEPTLQEGIDGPRLILNSTCEGQDLDVSKDESTTIMDGDCGEVTVTASRATVNIDAATGITVSGDGNTIIVTRTGAVRVSGSSNIVNWSEGAADPVDTGTGNRFTAP